MHNKQSTDSRNRDQNYLVYTISFLYGKQEQNCNSYFTFREPIQINLKGFSHCCETVSSFLHLLSHQPFYFGQNKYFVLNVLSFQLKIHT